MIRLTYICILVAALSSCSSNNHDGSVSESHVSIEQKINGVSYEMPSTPVDQKTIGEVKRINTGWVALIPYAWTNVNEAAVNYDDNPVRWWGESSEGTEECIKMARANGLKTMLKPHVWVVGQGWPGKFDLKTEKEWLEWEQTYREYILTFARLAEKHKVDLFCIGTEYRISIVKRQKFWEKLIKEVREIYNGPLTYASNWDNYERVKFWKQLDYIGIDAYFPLSNKAQPSLSELKKAWKPVEKKLEKLSARNGKPILFTEYGYKSIEYTNAGFWKYKEDTVKTNFQTQDVAYKALFETVWQKDWMAGGFLWKWHLYKDEKSTFEHFERRYSPQQKEVEKTISKYYN